MATYSIDDAQAALESLIDRVEAGEEIEIVSPNGGRVRLVPLTDDDRIPLAGEPIA